MNAFSKKTFTVITLGGASLCIVLMAARAFYAISFHTPLQLMTSGAEYESLYVIWKYINGLTVYADHTQIPYAGSFYNWVYYFFYGEVTGLIIKSFSLNDAWLPTIARLITVTGTIYGVWITCKLFFLISPNNSVFFKKIGLALAVLIFLGPLMGFFGIAAQPDIWGFAIDVTAIYLFLRFYDERPLLGVVLFCCFAYLAWGFKQIFIFSTGTVGLFLFIRRDWKMLITLIGISFAGWGATLSLGTSQYIKTIIMFGGSTVAFDSANLIRNLSNFFIKTLPILLGLFGIFAAIIINKQLKNLFKEIWHGLNLKEHRPYIGISLLGSLITGIIVIPASSKLGAAENYYFMLSFFLSLLLLSIMIWAEKLIEWSDTIFWPLGVGWALLGTAIFMVILGVTGVISTRHFHEENIQVRNCLVSKNLDQPLFIANQYLSLPWMIPAEENYVVQTNYRWDKPRGIKMEGGGVGGLIDKGYFATIILSGKTFDGSDLRHYQKRDEKCGSYNIFKRINARGN